MRPESNPSTGTTGGAFGADPVAVYAFVDRFFGSLVASGVESVCISPGSRSTPLAIGAERTSGLRTFVGLDERATSFFALGIAKASRRPVVILCTSGTAAANYLPAIVEAHYSRVPLIALTADRPPELRDWGAGQTIEQPGLYGRYVRWAAEVPLATRGEDGLRFAAQLGARVVDEAQGGPRGPVHLNWPFREPLAPPLVETPNNADSIHVERVPIAPSYAHSIAVARDRDVDSLVRLVQANERGVVCCGPMDAGPELVAALQTFATASGWPILADPASQLRGSSGGDGAPVLSLGDAILRAPGFSRGQKPDVVVRIGETPVSKVQRLWIESSEPEHVWWLDEGFHWGEPSSRATRVVRGGTASLLARSADRLAGSRRRESVWCRDFERAERSARKALDACLSDSAKLSGLVTAACSAHALGETDTLFASNSMSIRLLDLVHDGSNGPVRILCNRGASGIDGITSTALGIASASAGRTLLLTGDLAFLHDLSGLLITKHEPIDCVIVVIDDDGGGIFSFLPIAEQEEASRFERLFGTPHGLDLSRVAALFGLGYAQAATREGLDAAIGEGFVGGGVQIVHVPLDRKENQERYREVLAKVASRVDSDAAS